MGLVITSDYVVFHLDTSIPWTLIYYTKNLLLLQLLLALASFCIIRWKPREIGSSQ